MQLLNHNGSGTAFVERATHDTHIPARLSKRKRSGGAVDHCIFIFKKKWGLFPAVVSRVSVYAMKVNSPIASQGFVSSLFLRKCHTQIEITVPLSTADRVTQLYTDDETLGRISACRIRFARMQSIARRTLTNTFSSFPRLTHKWKSYRQWGFCRR